MKKKKNYEAPTIQVVKIENGPQLLQMSGIPPYTPGGDPLNP